MMPHYGDQHLLRQFQIPAVETSENRGRELGDVNEGMEQIRIGLGTQSRDAGLDLLAPLGSRQDHAVGSQLLIEILDGDWNRWLPENPVSYRRVARLHAADLERYHGVPQQRDQPTDWPNKTLGAFPIPNHGLRPLNLQNQWWQLASEQCCDWQPLGSFGKTAIVALGGAVRP